MHFTKGHKESRASAIFTHKETALKVGFLVLFLIYFIYSKVAIVNALLA